MIGTFADSFYFIALLNPSDQYHEDAKLATTRISAPVVVTSCVLVEVADALSAPGFRGNVEKFLRRLAADPKVRIVVTDVDWYDRGLALYAARPDKEWSLTDCISFEVMKQLELTDALTGDRHFEQAGFRALLKHSTER